MKREKRIKRVLKVRRIADVAIMMAAMVVLCATVATAVIGGFSTESWWIIALWIVGGGVAAYFLTYWAVRRFVIYKIKPIYQIVLSRNLRTEELETELAKRPNLMEYVGDKLSVWADANRREIERLKENEKYRRDFLGNVSHELKTPIFNIQGYISTLLDGALTDEKVLRKYLERSEKSIDRLINIVDDLDEISRLESGVLNLNLRRFDIVQLTRDIVESLSYEATERNIVISLGDEPAVPQPPVIVRADRRYIDQVINNLVVNSVRYGREGGHTHITFYDLFDRVMIEVSDNGIGIDKADLPRIFERFYRVDKSRSREQGGTGLGLAIVKHIIEAHHEGISVRSEVGKGTTFSFTLSKN